MVLPANQIAFTAAGLIIGSVFSLLIPYDFYFIKPDKANITCTDVPSSNPVNIEEITKNITETPELKKDEEVPQKHPDVSKEIKTEESEGEKASANIEAHMNAEKEGSKEKTETVEEAPKETEN